MDARPTFTIETPIGKSKIELREWITGREREYIDAPMYSAVSATPKQLGKQTSIEIGKIDITTLVTEQSHRKITTFVVSIDGNKENILERVLDMHEDDMAAIEAEIESKKKPIETPTV